MIFLEKRAFGVPFSSPNPTSTQLKVSHSRSNLIIFVGYWNLRERMIKD
jgi:hypothetical protein